MDVRELVAGLPPEIRARRELSPFSDPAAYRQNLARNLSLFEAVRPVLDAGGNRFVHFLPLKGLALAEPLYGDIALRPMSDLDIAVRPEQLHQAVALLEELGWRRLFPERARYQAPHAHDIAFVDGEGHVLELHYRLYHELRADPDVMDLFARSISVDLLGRRRRVPSWEDQLFFVAVHAATHAFGESVTWLIDLALLAERAPVELAWWTARKRRAGPAFNAALRTAHRLLPQIAVPRGDLLRKSLLQAILGRQPLARPPTQLQSLLARAVLTERPADALREIIRKLRLRAVEWRERRSEGG